MTEDKDSKKIMIIGGKERGTIISESLLVAGALDSFTVNMMEAAEAMTQLAKVAVFDPIDFARIETEFKNISKNNESFVIDSLTHDLQQEKVKEKKTKKYSKFEFKPGRNYGKQQAEYWADRWNRNRPKKDRR